MRRLRIYQYGTLGPSLTLVLIHCQRPPLNHRLHLAVGSPVDDLYHVDTQAAALAVRVITPVNVATICSWVR